MPFPVQPPDFSEGLGTALILDKRENHCMPKHLTGFFRKQARWRREASEPARGFEYFKTVGINKLKGRKCDAAGKPVTQFSAEEKVLDHEGRLIISGEFGHQRGKEALGYRDR